MKGLKNLKSIYESIYELDKNQIFNMISESIEIGSLYRGIKKKTFFIKANLLRIQLYYLVNDIKIRGFYLNYEFKQEDCFEIIFYYCFFIAGEFRFENPIKLYNGYIYTIREYLESINIQTITMSEIRFMENKLGEEVLHIGAIILKDIQEIDFYRELFKFDYSTFKAIENRKYVYLLFNEKNGFFKIGYSKNPLKREKTLQAEEPNVVLLKVWEEGMSFEKKLHRKYFKQKVRGEWFNFTFKELYELKEL
ncbi:GIY-YIG nuclease family protein [Sphingobacterium sp.]|uniref:GIY-YIG nuclease family protein n=1 Tax=Sphingobacterium sp. TaxID=341027 RepID=UPI0028ADE3D6|nr:GIY-YIG nuclease family protein [Sphingobacterium sp.]